MRKIKRATYPYRFEILFASLLMIVFGDILFPPRIQDAILLPIFFSLSLLASFNIVSAKQWKSKLLATLFILSIILELLSASLDVKFIRLSGFTMSIIGYCVVTFEILRQILRAKEVNSSTLYAVLCGFLLLGIGGSIVFYIVEFLSPGSFGVPNREVMFPDLLYFSFITLTTVGFGDIAPLTFYAKKLTIFFCTAGHFYSVVVMGLILGKYLSSSESKKE